MTRIQPFTYAFLFRCIQAILLGSSAFVDLGQCQLVAEANAKSSSSEAKPPIVLGAETIASRDIRYADSNDPLHTLDIYTCRNFNKAPVFVFIHGGGWNKRDKDEVGSQPKLFNSSGMIVVSLNYRLAPAIRHPENVRDVASAIAWLHKNIAKLGGDPNRIFLMGHSAGSHLAALVATDERYLAAHGLHRNQLAGVISLDGSAFDIPDRIKNGSEKIAENCRLAFGESLEVQVDGSPFTMSEADLHCPPFYYSF